MTRDFASPFLIASIVSAAACAPADREATPGARQAPPLGAAAAAAREAARADSVARLPAIATCDSSGCTPDTLTVSVESPSSALEEPSLGDSLPSPTFARGGLARIPAVYTDSGACPGEGCWKGVQWGVRSRVALYAQPDTTSAVIVTLEPDTHATALGWVRRTVPQPFVVTKATSADGRQGKTYVRGDHAVGDTLWVLTYLGEGHFRVRLPTGAVVEDYNLEFSAGGGTYGKRCERHPACWGVLAAELETSQWMRLRTADGREGWSSEFPKFVIPD